jgi:hypothetical protein
MTEEVKPDINQIQAQLTASKVLVAILETLGRVRVETKTLVSAENKDKELVVDYDENGPAFIFSVASALVANNEEELINDFE